MPKKSARRPRRDEKQWTEIFKRFESAAAEFVELVPTVQTPAASFLWSLDVSLPNGVCLRFRG